MHPLIYIAAIVAYLAAAFTTLGAWHARLLDHELDKLTGRDQ